MPTLADSSQWPMRSATANVLRQLADLIEQGHPSIEKVSFDTIQDLPRYLNLKPAPEAGKVTYVLEVVTFMLEQITVAPDSAVEHAP